MDNFVSITMLRLDLQHEVLGAVVQFFPEEGTDKVLQRVDGIVDRVTVDRWQLLGHVFSLDLCGLF